MPGAFQHLSYLLNEQRHVTIRKELKGLAGSDKVMSGIQLTAQDSHSVQARGSSVAIQVGGQLHAPHRAVGFRADPRGQSFMKGCTRVVKLCCSSGQGVDVSASMAFN